MMWCTAAQSSGYGPSGNDGISSRIGRTPSKWLNTSPARVRVRSSPDGIDSCRARNPDGPDASTTNCARISIGSPRRTPRKRHAIVVELGARQLDAIAIVHARRDRLAHEVMIHVRPHPVRVGDRIVGARRDEQPLRIEPASANGSPG